MRLKEFFRLTKGKIILAVILSLVIIYFVVSADRMCPAVAYTKDSCPEGYMMHIQPFAIGSCPSCASTTEIILGLIFPLIIYFIFSYLLSCLIFFGYSKIKKK